jgi:FecR protein
MRTSIKGLIIKRLIIKRLATGLILAGTWVSPVFADSAVTSAQVYKVSNQVDLDRQNQGSWSPASVGDALVPRDAVRTGTESRAELLFNEGTLVRTGEGTTFRFPPGRRSFELEDGSALFIIRPGQGDSRVQTPQAAIVAHGTALFVQHDPKQNISVVGVLSNSPAGPVTVTDLNGQQTIELTAGQFVSVANGVIGLVENFILPMFYQSVTLANGLGSGQENLIAQESAEVQQTLQAVRAETVGPLQSQVVWIQDFCSANVGTVQTLAQNTPLLGLLFPASIPPVQLSVQVPEDDLVITPMRSLAGLLWLGNYCHREP